MIPLTTCRSSLNGRYGRAWQEGQSSVRSDLVASSTYGNNHTQVISGLLTFFIGKGRLCWGLFSPSPAMYLRARLEPLAWFSITADPVCCLAL